MPTAATLVWLTPALFALFLYGVAQGLVKKYIGDVSPARFCLFFVVARSLVFLLYFLTHDHPPPFAAEGRTFAMVAFAVYVLDGLGWILYYRSILMGPITIVGTVSAAYPAPTVLFARLFLGEVLSTGQYIGVALVMLGCLGLAYERPKPGETKVRSRTWIVLAGSALILWGAAQTLLKYAYELPAASEANVGLFATFGGLVTLGVYGWLYGRRTGEARANGSVAREWSRSFVPMAMMAGGDLGVIIATEKGPVSIVTPLTAAYPIVTIAFAALFLKEKITPLQYALIAVVLAGIYLCPGSG